MTIPNEELVQKAVITADSLAAAGKLNPKQAEKFIDFVIDETMLKNVVRVARFRNETLDIDKIGVGDRVAVPAREATAPRVRRGVNTSKVTLSPVEIMVPFEIGDTFKEINIEGDDIETHIIKMMATQLANDMEELMINGDTVGPAVLEADIIDGGSSTQYINDSYLALFNGWLRLFDNGNVTDAANANISTRLLSRAMNSLPEKFKKNLGNMRWLTSSNLEQLFRERISTRSTASGDDALNSMKPLSPFGVLMDKLHLLAFQPKIVENITLGLAGVPISLRYAPLAAGSVVVTDQTLGATPVVPYVDGVDYNADYTNGTIAAAAPLASAAVKVTYQANPQIMLTLLNNLVLGIGRDIRIEKDRDIFKRVNQYAITAKVAVEVEEITATAKIINVGTSL